MTLLKIVEPEVGTKNSIADPRIPAALKEIEKVVNGELEGTNNLQAGGVLEGNLSAALQEKLTTKLGLKLEGRNESFTAVSEHLYRVEKEGATAELPAPTVNRMVGVYCSSAINAVKVKCSSGKIFSGLHQEGATTVEVTRASTLIVMADGTNWQVIAGQEKSEQKYGARTARALATPLTPNVSRPTVVIIDVALEPTPGFGKAAKVFVNGAQVTELFAGGHTVESGYRMSTSFTVPPGQSWEVRDGTGSGGVGGLFSTYLTG